MFNKLKKEVSDNFNKLSKNTLFYVDINRDEIWNQYLAGFPDEFRQENNCNACKSFLRQFAGIVVIKDNKVVSLWDNIAVPEEYADAVQNLRNYIHSRPITDIFLGKFKKCGTDKNLDSKREGVLWQHFYIELPNNLVAYNADTVLGNARDNKNVLKRGLDELTISATEEVLELVNDKLLYRGNEFEGMLKEFHKLQKEYSKVVAQDKDNYCWANSTKLGAVNRIRNSAIGTLLINLSEGMETEQAVKKFEQVVAPANYKRPTALVTPKMIEQAKQTLSELGLLEALNRRHANSSDILVTDTIFTFNPKMVKDVFEELSAETVVNPKTLKNVEEIGIEEFIRDVVPNATSISALLQNQHEGNLVSLLTAQDNEVPFLFKWKNHFSWNYNGNLADSMKERVKAAGGKVEGALLARLEWNHSGGNNIDFDLHCKEPNGNEIYFGNCRYPTLSKSSGSLDVDIINPGGKIAVENIVHTNLNKMPFGDYRYFVNNFSSNKSRGGFKAEIEFDGQTYEYEYGKDLSGKQNVDFAVVSYTKNGFTIKSLLDSKSSVTSIKKWNIGTNQYHKVIKFFLSPNHWVGTERIGNKHYMFMLENCLPENPSRPFYNEFLKPELDIHRKTFEMLSDKLKVEPSTGSLNGLGFSETQRAELIVKVEGNFKRNFKIKF